MKAALLQAELRQVVKTPLGGDCFRKLTLSIGEEESISVRQLCLPFCTINHTVMLASAVQALDVTDRLCVCQYKQAYTRARTSLKGPSTEEPSPYCPLGLVCSYWGLCYKHLYKGRYSYLLGTLLKTPSP